MTNYLGDFATGSTVYVYFDTFSGAGASVTMTGFAVTDIEIYKNGSTTQRSSDNGVTLLDTDGTDFDGITGVHGFSIDLSDNTDSGFYAAGNDYTVVVSSVTIDGQTVSFIAARFSIQNRYMRGTDSAYTGTPATAAAIADAVWDEARSGHVAAGSFGEGVLVQTVNADALNTNSFSTGCISAAAIAANAIGATELAADAITEIVDGVWANATRTLTADTNINYPSAATIATSVLTTQMTESYSADGVAPTLAQAQFLTLQRLYDFAISGTTISVKKLDGTTQAAAITIDDATTPTSSSRSA